MCSPHYRYSHWTMKQPDQEQRIWQGRDSVSLTTIQAGCMYYIVPTGRVCGLYACICIHSSEMYESTVWLEELVIWELHFCIGGMRMANHFTWAASCWFLWWAYRDQGVFLISGSCTSTQDESVEHHIPRYKTAMQYLVHTVPRNCPGSAVAITTTITTTKP